MIVFDLDGTLANCEHRRHLVDRDHPKNQEKMLSSIPLVSKPHPNLHVWWKPDWNAFYEACDKDTPIKPVIDIMYNILSQRNAEDIRIWSGRCSSVRKKTIDWLNKHLIDWNGRLDCISEEVLKMRPIGDSTPDDVLKGKWLEEALSEGHEIEYVFDDRPKVIRMWRRRGIFVFNCCQHDNEF